MPKQKKTRLLNGPKLRQKCIEALSDEFFESNSVAKRVIKKLKQGQSPEAIARGIWKKAKRLFYFRRDLGKRIGSLRDLSEDDDRKKKLRQKKTEIEEELSDSLWVLITLMKKCNLEFCLDGKTYSPNGIIIYCAAGIMLQNYSPAGMSMSPNLLPAQLKRA